MTRINQTVSNEADCWQLAGNLNRVQCAEWGVGRRPSRAVAFDTTAWEGRPTLQSLSEAKGDRVSSSVSVHLLPLLFDREALSGGVAVVIDVLRASTTIIQAFAAGAEMVIPCDEVETAQGIARLLPPDKVLLGGERHGARIPGFDLDNSPLKYVPETVAGKTLAFTTTNGTRALTRCQLADRVLIGAFVNRQAIVDALVQDGRPVHLVCAGTDGLITSEDVLFGGAVAQAVRERRQDRSIPDDETQLALALWQTAKNDADQIRQILRDSRGGRNLLELGFDHDIDRAAQCDLFKLVPEYDADQSLIRVFP